MLFLLWSKFDWLLYFWMYMFLLDARIFVSVSLFYWGSIFVWVSIFDSLLATLSFGVFFPDQMTTAIVTIVQHSRDFDAPIYVQRMLRRWLMPISECRCYPTGFWFKFRFKAAGKHRHSVVQTLGRKWRNKSPHNGSTARHYSALSSLCGPNARDGAAFGPT